MTRHAETMTKTAALGLQILNSFGKFTRTKLRGLKKDEGTASKDISRFTKRTKKAYGRAMEGLDEILEEVGGTVEEIEDETKSTMNDYESKRTEINDKLSATAAKLGKTKDMWSDAKPKLKDLVDELTGKINTDYQTQIEQLEQLLSPTSRLSTEMQKTFDLAKNTVIAAGAEAAREVSGIAI